MEYRIATISDCEALTDIRMQMRKELDADFNSALIYEKLVDCLEKRLIYRHIRRFAD